MSRFGIGLLALSLAVSAQAADGEWHGMLDARLAASDSDRGWLHDGLDKQRFDRHRQGLRLGQAVLSGKVTAGTWSGQAWLNGYEGRDGAAGIGEAYLQWRPLPASAWRWKAKAGMFFPELSLENHGAGWTSRYLISSSALNTWVGEELRALGAEATLQYNGALAGSAHDWQATAGAFRWNDPAGGLLAWRGWSVGDRVTSSGETVPFPDLAIFRPGGYWGRQIQGVDPFREIDHKTGYYASLGYRYLDRFAVTAMRYDNRGDPTAYEDGQWAWDTTFNHLGLGWYGENTTWLAQVMDGRTVMGYIPFHDLIADFRSWYVLASHQRGQHRFTVRYDAFDVHDRDGKAADPNQEDGEALAAGWNWQFRKDMDAGLEWLRQDSDRESRRLLGQPAERSEDLWQGRVRWWF
jgi:hypothetical protein